jgi:Fe-S-cluster-containing dehydrogenase component/CRP-like cAMP-binding protein
MAKFQVIDRPKRWDVPFWEEGRGTVRCAPMDDAMVERLMKVRPFRLMKDTPRLRDLLANDTRLRLFDDREIVVRQGDYGNAAFLILHGRVKVFKDVPRTDLGYAKTTRKSLWQELTQRLTNSRARESRDTSNYPQLEHAPPGSLEGDDFSGGNPIFADVPISKLPEKQFKGEAEGLIERPAMFGELAALGRMPRSATIASDGEAKLLEIRWQGLRDLRNYDDAFKQQIDDNYRQHGLSATLQESDLLGFLHQPEHAEVAQRIAEDAVFETYGRFDWHGTYQQLREKQADPLSEEPVICKAGEVPNGLILIRAGFARLSRPHGAGERTVSYLRRGDTFGLAELAHNAHGNADRPLATTLRAVGYVDVVRIPTRTFEQAILPHLNPKKLPKLPPPPDPPSPKPTLSREAPKRRVHDRSLPILQNGHAARDPGVDTGMLEFLVENRFVNGTQTMLIDLDRCTRCDDCVAACASGHNNNPRFIRHGQIHGHHMVANACMHCADPVCMIGCPTGAIHRTEASGEVVINDNTCIGCGTCAINCPYENIRLVPIRNANDKNALMVNDAGKAIEKATKCDLCVEHHGGPACQRACPHDALQRVNLGDLAELARGVGR